MCQQTGKMPWSEGSLRWPFRKQIPKQSTWFLPPSFKSSHCLLGGAIPWEGVLTSITNFPFLCVLSTLASHTHLSSKLSHPHFIFQKFTQNPSSQWFELEFLTLHWTHVFDEVHSKIQALFWLREDISWLRVKEVRQDEKDWVGNWTNAERKWIKSVLDKTEDKAGKSPQIQVF